MQDNSIKEDKLNLREIVKPYLKKWYWFIISGFVAIALAFFYIKVTVPIYKIQTSVYIKDAKKTSGASGEIGMMAGLSGLAGMGTNSIENELEIFKSKQIIEDVVKDLKLQTSIFSKEKYYNVELYKDTSPLTINVVNEKPFEVLPKDPIAIKLEGNKITLSSDELDQDIVTAYNKTISLPYANIIISKNPNFNPAKVKKLNLDELSFTYSDLETVTDNFKNSLKVDLLDKDATIIGLTLDYPNKEKAVDILNQLTYVYNGYAISDKNVESKKTKEFIDDRILIISQELGQVEDRKEDFKTKNKISDLPTEIKLNLQTSTEAKTKALELESQIELSNILLGYLNSSKNTYEVLPTNIGMDMSSPGSSAVSGNLNLYNAAIMQRNRLLENATLENPLVKENAKEIAALRESLKESLLKSKTSFEIARKNLLGEKGESDEKIGKVPSQEKIFRSIERQQAIKEQLYLLLLQKREEAAIAMAMTSNKARVIDTAYADKKPIAPKKMIILLGALIVGCLVPLGFIYFKELFNNKIIDKKDLEELSDTGVIAEIPRLNKGDIDLIQMNDVSPLAEAFRILVTNVNYMLPKKDTAKIVFVTSTAKGEGKTFISVNLSLALATSKKKILVIGSDIRNPQLQRYNPKMIRAVGLSEYLYGSVENVKEIIHPSGFITNCDFIYSGMIPPNPTELLQNGKYQELLDAVQNDYDIIVLDTAPLMLVTDSFLISHFADATIYVTRSEVSQKDYIEFANGNISTNKIKNVAFVLNDVHKTNFGYGNKYGYGYNAEEKKWWGKLFSR